MSAQWGDNGDTAVSTARAVGAVAGCRLRLTPSLPPSGLQAVMYACQVGAGGSTTSGSTLEPTKQWWILVPTDGSTDSSWGASQLTKLQSAQAESVAVRTAANSRSRRALDELESKIAGEISGEGEELSVEERVMLKWSLKKRATAKAKAAAVSARLAAIRAHTAS